MLPGHKVRINVANKRSGKQTVLQSRQVSLPKRLLTFFFGDFCEILVLTPGSSVHGIEIKEMRGGGSD